MNTFPRRIFAASIFTAAFVVTAVFALPPTSVGITSPSDGAVLTVTPTTPVIITANAAPSASGSIVSVDFRVNGTSIGNDTIAPYEITWVPTAAGTFSLTALATDSSSSTTNNTLLSAPINVTVASVRTVAVVSPASNSSIAQNSQIFLRANTAISDGLVKHVQFSLTNTSTNTTTTLTPVLTTAPYALQTTLTQAPGSYTVRARTTASDDTFFDSAPIPFTIVQPIGTGPSATIISPSATDVVVASSNATISATAADTDQGTVT